MAGTGRTECKIHPGGGYSEDGDTITISSAEGLAWLAVQVNGMNGVQAESFSGKTIVLDGDIDLSGKLWTPIGASQNETFQGNFDGKGHTISNMTIVADNGEKYMGLFGQAVFMGEADHPSFIRDVSLTNVSITTGNVAASSPYAGVLAGEVRGGYGQISGCTVDGQMICQNGARNYYAGGLIGCMNPTTNMLEALCVRDSVADVTIQGAASFAGGLVGIAGSNSVIEHCGAAGDIAVAEPLKSLGSSAGGLVGTIDMSNGPVRIRKCYATGNVSLKSKVEDQYGNYAGGFLGSVDWTGAFSIEECMSSGDVSVISEESANVMKMGGGFAGNLLGPGTVSNCYATGNVEVTNGSYSIGGGFVGTMYGVDGEICVTNCYTTGNVTALNGANQSRAFGFSGNTSTDTRMQNCYALGVQMKAEGTNPLAAQFLSTSATIEATDCGYYQNMDLGTAQQVGSGMQAVNAMDEEQIKALFQNLSDSNPAWELGNGGYPILTQVRKDVQQTDKLDYLYPYVTFDARNGSQPVVQSVKNGTASRPEDPVWEGYVFEGWYTSGDGGVTLADNPFDFDTPVTTDVTLYGKWTIQHEIQVTASPADGGTVTGGGVYKDGAEVLVTATPGEGYRFVRWTEIAAEVSTDPVYRFTASAGRVLTAEFEPVPEAERYQITVSANSIEGGTVTGGGTYIAGVVATVTAIPNSGYRFVHWTENGTAVSTSEGYSFTVSGNRVLLAEFETTGSDNPENPKPENPNPDNPAPDNPAPDNPSADDPQNPTPSDPGNNGGTLPPADPIIVPGNNGNRPGNNDGNNGGGSSNGNNNGSNNGSNNGNHPDSSGTQSTTAGNENAAGRTKGVRQLDQTPNTGV